MDTNDRPLGGRGSRVIASGAPAPRDEKTQAIEFRSLGILGADDAAHRHEGSFAVGQEMLEHHPERLGEKGDFAAGE